MLYRDELSKSDWEDLIEKSYTQIDSKIVDAHVYFNRAYLEELLMDPN